MPVTPIASLNILAWLTAFCPVVASRTSRTSCGAPGNSRLIIRLIFFQFLHQVCLAVQSCLLCRQSSHHGPWRWRPSARRTQRQMDRSRFGGGQGHSPSVRPRSPAGLLAAARNVSPATNSTERPAPEIREASLPIVVVLPEPFTPMTRMTNGLATRFCLLFWHATGQDFGQILFHKFDNLRGVPQKIFLHVVAQVVNYPARDVYPYVGG